MCSQKWNNSSKKFVRLFSTAFLQGTIYPLKVMVCCMVFRRPFKIDNLIGRILWNANDRVKHTSNFTFNVIISTSIVKGGFYYGGTTPD